MKPTEDPYIKTVMKQLEENLSILKDCIQKNNLKKAKQTTHILRHLIWDIEFAIQLYM